MKKHFIFILSTCLFYNQVNAQFEQRKKINVTDSLNKIETNITIEDIQKTVVSYYNISMHDFMSSRRSRSVARPRQIAMYLSKKMTTKSLPDIGRRFSGRDHTTVIHAIKKVEELMIQDKNFENEVKDLNQKLTKTV